VAADLSVTQPDGGLAPPSLAAARRRRRPVLAFLARRLLAGVATLLVASMLIFAMVEVLPGDVASAVLGRSATPSAVTALEKKLELNRSVPERYVDWLGGLVRGRLGDSAVGLAQDAPDPGISARLGEPMRNSAILALIAFICFLPLALGLGVLAGVNAGRPVDYVLSLIALAINALPEFVIGTFLIVIFFSQLGWFPPVVGFGPGESPLDHLNSLVLPVLTLLLAALATGLRMVRAGVVEASRQDYVAMARLNGFRGRRVVRRYIVRNAMAPSVIAIAQVAAYLVAGIIITENVFNYPGVGRLLVDAVKNRDVTLVEDVAMILASLYVVLNIVADLIVVLLVPKLRTSQR
jgi:peptide/nickel transport system permease protein